MTPQTWAAITGLFEQAVERPPAERDRFLAQLRLQDPGVASELASLLEAHDRPGEFLPDLTAPGEPPDLAGRVVGAYRLLQLLGTGGMGSVYLAERSDGAFAKHVAVKLLSAALLPSRDRFLREREYLARLDHPNIARLLDAGATTDHVPYLVMEYVEGVPIDRYCADPSVTIEQRVALLLQVCAGVAHAHRNLIIHCDIKPENILVTRDGMVKLLDFGIARLLDPARAVTQYRPATPAYSSPEQLQGGAITTTSDVYSLGVLAYVLLTGSRPYALRSEESARVDEIVHAVLTTEPRRASMTPGLAPRHARKLKGDLDNILAKAVAREPARRYASVEQLGDDLQAYRTGFPVRARPATMAYRLRRAASRHRLVFVVGGILGAALVAATAFSTWQAQVAQRRFDDLHTFARAVVFDVNDALAPIPGTVAARKLVVETALRYLDRLSQERLWDPALRAELAAAYIRIGKVQGGAFLPNLGDSTGAIKSFRTAIAASADGATPELERVRIEALINLALLAADPIDGAPDFDAAIVAAERRLSVDPRDIQSLRLLADAFHGRATVAHLTNNVPEHLAMARRQVDVRERLRAQSQEHWPDDASLARALAQHALALEQQGAASAALVELMRARAILESAITRSAPNQILHRGLAEIRSRAIPVLLALGRPADASIEARAAIDLLEPLVDSDPMNVQYRADLAYAWLRLGDVLRVEGRLKESLDVHRRALTIRRDRAARHAGFIFVPWELTRSLNSVADLLLAQSPPRPDEAAALFAEARDIGTRTLVTAPSFTQVRKQVAIAEEGLARTALTRSGGDPDDARPLLQRSVDTWRIVILHSAGDQKSIDELRRIETQLSAPLGLSLKERTPPAIPGEARAPGRDARRDRPGSP
jgi:tetratricopeptide (TPR) repeat protein